MTNSIEIKHIVKNFGQKVAVNDVNLDIHEGELFALLGVNGAGKTTLIKILTCLLTPSSGDALLCGSSIVKDSNSVKNIVNVSPQETAIAPNLSVEENLYFISGIYEIGNTKNIVEGLIGEFGLEEVRKQSAKTLSGGWQRRLSIAMALVNDPKIIFLDEPTLGLDVLARRELWKVIESLKGKKTIVLTTHYMEEAEMLADRVGIMVEGHLLEVGTSKELIKLSNAKNFEDAFVNIATRNK